MEKEELSFNPNKISSMKMLFFAAIPNLWRERLNNNRFKCLRRGKNYRLFEKGIKKYEEEIDIVTVIRDMRWLKIAVNELMEESGESRRAKFSKLVTLKNTIELNELSNANPKE